MAVCTDGASLAFVADSNGRTVHVFNLQSRAYTTWQPPTGFGLPVALAFDTATRRLLVADSLAACLVAFTPDGSVDATLGKGSLTRPCGIALANDGRIFVADVGTHQIVILSPSGSELARIGRRGPALGEFNYPTNLAFDSSGRLYVSDSLNFRVQVFSKELTPLRQIGSQGDLPGYFAQPKGIALDPDQHVYVVDAQFEAFQLFNTDGALLMSVGREGQGPGEFWLPAGIHIDPLGRVWIADTNNRRVQVFQYLREEPTR
jgi:sugar lactone lactonase YvrE